MLKKLKAIRNHKIFKDFVFVFFGGDTYKNHKAKKEVMPIDIYYYEGPLIFTHALYHFCFSVYLVTYVTIKYGFYYFVFEFGKKDLGYIIKELALAFGVGRIPFLVIYINLADYALDFYEFIRLKRYKKYRFFKRKKTRKRIRRIKKKLKKLKKFYRFIKKMFVYFRLYYLYQYTGIDKIECLFFIFC